MLRRIMGIYCTLFAHN